MWQLLKTTCYGPLAIHTICKYNLICATLYNFFVLVHNTGENTIFSFLFCFVVFFGNFWSTEDFNWKKKLKKKFFSEEEEKKRRKMISCFLSTVMGSSDSKHQELSWPDRCPSRCVASGEEVRVTSWLTPPLSLWLTVAYFDPLSDE